MALNCIDYINSVITTIMAEILKHAKVLMMYISNSLFGEKTKEHNQSVNEAVHSKKGGDPGLNCVYIYSSLFTFIGGIDSK